MFYLIGYENSEEKDNSLVIDGFITKMEIVTMAEKKYSIREAAHYLGIGEFYMRRMIREGKMPTTKQAINNKGGFRHLVAKKDLDNYTATKGRKNDGKVVYNGRFDKTNIEAVNKVLKDAGFPELEPRYQPKNK